MAQDDDSFMIEEAPEREVIVIQPNEIEVGAGWVSSSSFKFGEYTGLVDSGPFAIGNLYLQQRAPYDSDSTEYWTALGTDLGLDSRAARVEYGHQGTFSIFGDYEEIPHFIFSDGMTPYNGVGTSNLTLPGGWMSVPTSSTDSFDLFNTNSGLFQNVEISTERTQYGGGFTWNVDKAWEVTGSFHQQDKDGTSTIAGIFGTNGGNPRSIILPQPIDQTTQEGNLNLLYSDERLQAQLSYNVSLFNNNLNALVWDNPYEAVGGFAPWDPSQSFSNGGQGRLALDPDNTAHNISLAGGYTLGPTTRIAGNFAYGLMQQDDTFLPYTINPFLTADGGGPLVPLPKDSLDGQVNTLHGNLNLTTRPMRDLRIQTSYRYDKRDNETPVEVFLTVPNDTADQSALDSSGARVNRPYSYTKQNFDLETSYRVVSSTRVTLGYDFETISRDLQEVADTYEHTGSIKIQSTPMPSTSGWIEYAYSSRTGSQYISNEPVLVGHSEEYIASEPPAALFENNPYLRKYYLANRIQNVVKGSFTYIASDDFTLGLTGTFSGSDYDDSVLGLNSLNYGSGTVNATYLPREDLTLTGFFTYGQLDIGQTGWERSNVPITPTTPIDPMQIWMVDTTNHAYTAGLEVEWEAIPDKLTIGHTYTFSRTTTSYDFIADPVLGAQPLPDLKTTLNSVSLYADYKVMKNLTMRLAYLFEDYHTDDFALDGIGVPIPLVLTLGNDSPNYSVHVVGLSAIITY
jgi:MtrB/PioB family decaheme-associated outer membrane protein